jgi:hypothetical protein
MNIQQLAMPALAYFAIVFGIGFLLGSIRVLWLVPQLGLRYAELAEMPIMLLAIFFAARWVTQYFAVPPAISSRLVVGIAALICLLMVEFTVVLMVTRHQHCRIIRQSRPYLGCSLPSQSNLVCLDASVGEALD